MEIRITHRAIDRFIKFFPDDAERRPRSDIRFALERAASTARKLDRKTRLGDDMWEVEEPPCIFITKQDHHRAPIVCVTIIPSYRKPPAALEAILAMVDGAQDRIERLAALDPTPDLKAELRLAETEISILKEHAKTVRHLAEASKEQQRLAERTAKALGGLARDAMAVVDYELGRNIRALLGMSPDAGSEVVIRAVKQAMAESHAYREIRERMESSKIVSKERERLQRRLER